MTGAWTFGGESRSLTGRGTGGGPITLVDESSFCLSGRGGDIRHGTAQGLFVLDTRLISDLELRVDDITLEPLAVSTDEPFAATFVSRVRHQRDDAEQERQLLVVRRRYVGSGMREDIALRNHHRFDVRARVRIDIGGDFANLFAVKEGHDPQARAATTRVVGNCLVIEQSEGTRRITAVRFGDDASIDERGAEWDVVVPARGEWSTCFDVCLRIGDRAIPPRYRCGEGVAQSPAFHRLEAWRSSVPLLDTDDASLDMAVRRSLEDLGSLRLFDPENPARVTVAAGAPWFMAVFGRDSLITAFLSLIADPDLALGVLQTLARFQGTKVDPRTEEEPGRILHEMRFGDATTNALDAGDVYYGSIDATPLFVVLLGELRRWGLAHEAVDELLPHADRAIEWIEKFGDKDADGFVEYKRLSDTGLRNQGWKDSWDGIPFADGSHAQPPIALAEVQGYVYQAYLARAYFALERGDRVTSERFRGKAATLKAAFNKRFWLADRGYFAIALDGDKRPVDALASNMGHCLWSGIVDVDKAESVVKHLMSEEMFSGWGVRTLATSMASYDPMSYHCGSVWPHDNALAAAGLMRYGFIDEAHRVVRGILDAAANFGGRLPELFSGLARSDVPVPVSYPASCSPQAWAAASPLAFLRLLLRLDPWIPHGRIWLDPLLPSGMTKLAVSRIPVTDQGMRVVVDGKAVTVTGVGPELEIIRSGRPPISALLDHSA